MSGADGPPASAPAAQSRHFCVHMTLSMDSFSCCEGSPVQWQTHARSSSWMMHAASPSTSRSTRVRRPGHNAQETYFVPKS